MSTHKPLSKIPSSTWLLLISACLLVMLSFGYRSGFGLFVKPISEANGWGRDVIGFSMAIQNLVWGVVAVFAGGLADRFGNVRVIISGVVIYALGMGLMPHVTAPWMLHSTAGMMVGAGVAGTSFGIVLPALARAVSEDRRQWVLGVGTAAGSMGQFLVVPISQGLIDNVGWVNALHILALSAFAMAVLAMPLAPYAGGGKSETNVPAQTMRQALSEAFRHRSYVLLVAGFFVCGFHVAFITAHLPAYLSDLGFDAKIGAWSVATIGLFNVFGAYMSGIISGRRERRSVLIWIYLLRAVAITAFMLIPISLVSVFAFCAAMGLLWLATVPPTSGMVAMMFGTRYMSLLYGFVFLGHQLGSFSGVWLGGWTYERTGNYDLVWWIGIGLSLVAALLHWPIQEKPVERLTTQRMGAL
ncbi:MFS transporter [Leucothrix mucor]|uniref:MFS transporter n=1 Tax=Leucothrix mucor TaxID=45248 RepID=UPI0003B63667|nr:MFS transporter [Leucothrix mucor]